MAFKKKTEKYRYTTEWKWFEVVSAWLHFNSEHISKGKWTGKLDPFYS
jgi:hypothetical protein